MPRLEIPDFRSEVCQWLGTVRVRECEIELAAFGGGAFVRRALRDRIQVPRDRRDRDLVRGQRAVVNRQSADSAFVFEPKPPAHSQGLLGLDFLVHLVPVHLDLDGIAVDEYPQTLGEFGSVVGERHVAPLVQRNGIDALDADAVIEPAADEVHLDLPVDQVHAPARVRICRILGIDMTSPRHDGAVSAFGADPSGGAESIREAEIGLVSEIGEVAVLERLVRWIRVAEVLRERNR